MKKYLLLTHLLLCSILCVAQNRITVSPSSPMDRAVSGHYAGWINGELMTYGGCNFPDVPCADGGQKVFYPIAYGASVSVPQGVVFLGGMNADSSIAECRFVNATDGTSSNIASLPKGLDNFAAAYHDGVIFVAGGQSNGIPNKDVYALSFPGEDEEWKVVASLPDECRLQPCMAAWFMMPAAISNTSVV